MAENDELRRLASTFKLDVVEIGDNETDAKTEPVDLELEILCHKLKSENEFLKYTAENIEKVKEDKLDLMNRCKQLENAQTELLKIQVEFERFKQENERNESFVKANGGKFGVGSVSDLINLLSAQKLEICDLKDDISKIKSNLIVADLKSKSKDDQIENLKRKLIERETESTNFQLEISRLKSDNEMQLQDTQTLRDLLQSYSKEAKHIVNLVKN